MNFKLHPTNKPVDDLFTIEEGGSIEIAYVQIETPRIEQRMEKNNLYLIGETNKT